MIVTKLFRCIVQSNELYFFFLRAPSIVCVFFCCSCAVRSLQNAGGTYSCVALSPSVGCYAGGRFRSNVPIRVVQPATHANNSIDLTTLDNSHPGIKQEGQDRKRKRQAALPSITMSYEVKEGAWQGKMRVTICWRELLYKDDTGGQWVRANLMF